MYDIMISKQPVKLTDSKWVEELEFLKEFKYLCVILDSTHNKKIF